MRAFVLRAALAAGAAGVVATPRTALAQGTPTGFSLNRYEPADRGSRWFVLDSLDLRGHVRPAVGLTLDYMYRPLAIYGPNRTLKTAVVGHVVTTHLGGDLVFWERLRVGASLPLVPYGEGETGSLRGVTYAAPPKEQAAGDLRLGADVRLLGSPGPGGPIAVALGARLWLPTGSARAYTSDGRPRVGPRVSAAGQAGPFLYSAMAGAVFRHPQAATFADVPIDPDFVFAAAVGASLLKGTVTVGPELYGSTSIGDTAFKARSTPFEVLLGGHGELGYGFRAGVAAGTGFGPGYGSPIVRLLGALEWISAGALDADGDGVYDEEDACPRAAGVPSLTPTENGCPSRDRDKDGVPDYRDACPDNPGKPSSDPRVSGCGDVDGDDVFDTADACPDEPGVAQRDPARNGCPLDPDRDKDGVPDDRDACPGRAGVADPDPKKSGCPDPDRDKDGIPNETDACPDNAGPAHASPSRNGCPIAFIHGNEIWIKEQVKFRVGSAELLASKETNEVLQGVKDILDAHPEITKLNVRGHTDNRGDPQANRLLSEQRAAAVVAWLVKKGIAKERLSSAGFGQEQPLDANDSEQGRAANRRVEFRIEPSTPAPTP